MSVRVEVPNRGLVLLVGPRGSGKTGFAKKNFAETEVLSLDYFVRMISDGVEGDVSCKEALEVVQLMAAKRLASGLLTVIDATHLQPQFRAPWVPLARRFHLPTSVVIFDTGEISSRYRKLQQAIDSIQSEGFGEIVYLRGTEQIEEATVVRMPLACDRSDVSCGLDFIGDVHGCCDELEELILRLGYRADGMEGKGWMQSPVYRHPEDRKLVFVGDLVDRGSRILDTVRLVRNMVHLDRAICVAGNHDFKFLRWLKGKNVRETHGFAQTIGEIQSVPDSDPGKPKMLDELQEFFDGLREHYLLDGGRVVVAHAGLKEEYQGREGGHVREFAFYGETTGETDSYGLPVRLDWAASYRGQAMVIYGHTPVPEPQWVNRTLDIDTGCVFGGSLTALRYPEMELVSISAKREYCVSSRPFARNRARPNEASK